MKTYLLFLCLLGCTRLFLVVGVVPWRDIERLQNALRGIGLEKNAGKEHSALINDDSEAVRPDINPHGVEVEEVDNPTSTNGTTGTNGTTSQPTTVDITPTTTSATVANRTTSVPTILPTATVNRTSTRGPTTSSVHLATSTPVTATTSKSGAPSTTNTPTTIPRGADTRLIAAYVLGIGGSIIFTILCVVAFLLIWHNREKIRKCCSTKRKDDTTSESSDEEEEDDYAECFRSFFDQHPEYQEQRHKRRDLGSRVQKHWYQIEKGQERKIVTIAPVSQSCPLKLHKHQRGLNKLLDVLKGHPYLHSIELVEYLPDHELLVMVQPLMKAGSLKDMIYKAAPLTKWSKKYARRSSGLRPEKIARYGRQILEAMKFLYSKDFPTLGHVQSGNIFIVDDVCHLGGYENTLLGYKTRLFRLCKDHLQHFDVILFGHLVFEMAAGYELTHLRPSEEECRTVDKSVRPILEYIFEEGFPHDVNAISSHEFFSGSLSELNNFDPSQQVQLTKSMNKVLEKVRKGKPRVQRNKDGIETVVALVVMTFREIFGHGGEDSKEGLEEKPAESQKRLKPEVGRGGEASASDLGERSPKNQKTLKSTYGGAGKDLEGAREKKPEKSKKKSKMKVMKPGLTEPLLGDKAN